MSGQFLGVCGWDEFQHYKDRDPPWIKLYRDMLTSESWVLGTDVSRLVQVASLLLAARYKNQIPLQWGLLRKVASFDCTEKQFNDAVSHLVGTKFLEINVVTGAQQSLLQDASTLLDQSRAEKSREDTEQSREEGSRKQRARSATRLPDDFPFTPERRAIALAEHLDPDRTFAKFVDHWRAASGAKARKLDWDATWRNWCRNETDRNGASNGTGRQDGRARLSALERVRRANADVLDDDPGGTARGQGVVVNG